MQDLFSGSIAHDICGIWQSNMAVTFSTLTLLVLVG